MGINNNYYSNKKVYEIFDRWKMLLNSLKKNYLFVVCIIVQVFGLSILYPSNSNVGYFGNILFGIITFIVSIIIGYYVHVFSHLFDYKDIYTNLTKSKNWLGYLLRNMPSPIQFILNKIVYLLDFHDKIHHDTNINKKWQNIAIEILMNIYTEGIALILMCKFLDFGIKIRSYIFKLNYPILFAWSILYATIHNINYNIITPVCHIQHHLNESTNYGIDFMDIIFGSKYDNNPEEMNHASFNVIIIMLFIIFIKDYYQPNNKISKNIYNFISWFITN